MNAIQRCITDKTDNISQNKFLTSEEEDIISRLAQDETGKRQHYRPVYSLHKWWARRPGALFRSIILLADQPGRNLFAKNHNGCLSADSDYFRSHALDHIIILDPFMGGGTTLAEANRMGAKVIGCDLNPMSWWIVRETLKPVDLEKLDNYYRELEKSTGKKIRELYKTACSCCNHQADTLYAFWVRYVICPHCGEHAYLFKRTLLNTGLSRTKPPSPANPATAFCPQCFSLNEWNGISKSTCAVCGHHFDPQSETFDKGYYDCTHCHKKRISLLKTLENGQMLQEKLVAMEYICSCRGVRTYKNPDAQDLSQMEHIKETVEKLGDALIFPKQKIVDGTSSARWINHN